MAQTAFVNEDQEAPFPERFFLGRATPYFLRVLDLRFVAFPGSSHRPLRAPAQADQKLPDMALVIAHAELLLDQVSHPRAGPQRSLIAQPLGTREQKFGELFLIIESAQSAPGLGRNRFLSDDSLSCAKNTVFP